jgi:hypothetical protein
MQERQDWWHELLCNASKRLKRGGVLLLRHLMRYSAASAYKLSCCTNSWLDCNQRRSKGSTCCTPFNTQRVSQLMCT